MSTRHLLDQGVIAARIAVGAVEQLAADEPSPELLASLERMRGHLAAIEQFAAELDELDKEINDE